MLHASGGSRLVSMLEPHGARDQNKATLGGSDGAGGYSPFGCRACRRHWAPVSAAVAVCAALCAEDRRHAAADWRAPANGCVAERTRTCLLTAVSLPMLCTEYTLQAQSGALYCLSVSGLYATVAVYTPESACRTSASLQCQHWPVSTSTLQSIQCVLASSRSTV